MIYTHNLMGLLKYRIGTFLLTAPSQRKCKCQKRGRCGSCKCRKKNGGLVHPQDVNVDLETKRENYNRAKRAANIAIFNVKNSVIA